MPIASLLDFASSFSPFTPPPPSNTPPAKPTEDFEGGHAAELRKLQALAGLRENVLRLARECTSLRFKLDAVQQHLTFQPTTTTSTSLTDTTIPAALNNNTSAPMRDSQECDPRTYKEFRSQAAEVAKLLERCKRLETTIKSKDEEIEELKHERNMLLEEKSHSRGRYNDHSKSHNGASEDIYERRSEGSTTSSSSLGSHPSSRAHISSSSASAAPPSFREEYIAHLQSFDVFMTKTDNWSGAQVVQAVRDVNSEILQFAASLTESGTFEQRSPSHIAQAKHNTASRLGPNLAHILSVRDHAQDPILIQLALQSALCGCIHRSLASFCVGFPSKYDALLGQLYLRMCTGEPQAISSRWRSLTHRHMRGLFPSLDSQAVDELMDMMLRWSADILVLSGSSPMNVSVDALRSRFGVQLRRVAQGAWRLARVTREEIISTNFEVVAVEHETTFDGHTMINVFEQYGTSKGRVLCTSEIGLQCFRTGGEEKGQFRTLVPPTVVLESVVQVL